MAKSISSLLVDCLSLFNALVAREDLIARDAEVPASLWMDELGRLRVWAANIGVHQTGQSSLDYRLRDASHIRDQTIRLLERLRQTFDDLEEVLNGPSSDTLDDDGETEIQQIYRGFLEIVSCLFQMSII